MKLLTLLLLVLGMTQPSYADWKQKAGQCEARVAHITVGETSSWSEVSSVTPANDYYESLWSAIQETFEELDKKFKSSSVCQQYKLLYSPQYTSSESIPTSHGVWFKVGEGIHELWLPLNWAMYYQKVKKILVDPKYEDGLYRVCNYVCKHRRVDPEDSSIRFIPE
jgi:hypothetical protein